MSTLRHGFSAHRPPECSRVRESRVPYFFSWSDRRNHVLSPRVPNSGIGPNAGPSLCIEGAHFPHSRGMAPIITVLPRRQCPARRLMVQYLRHAASIRPAVEGCFPRGRRNSCAICGLWGFFFFNNPSEIATPRLDARRVSVGPPGFSRQSIAAPWGKPVGGPFDGHGFCRGAPSSPSLDTPDSRMGGWQWRPFPLAFFADVGANDPLNPPRPKCLETRATTVRKR